MLLPYLESDEDIHLNLSILLIIIYFLGKSSRGALKLNNGKLHIYFCLIKNPLLLNSVLGQLDSGVIVLQDRDANSILSLSPNIDPLFNRAALKSLLSILVAKELIEVVYKKGDGFFYILSENGIRTTELLKSEYLSEIKLICDKLKITATVSESKLNEALNQIIRKESV